jgi:hypothetical protein
MARETLPHVGPGPSYQSARLLVRVGRRGGLALRVNVTSGGLLSIAALVSSILLSTAVLVGVSVRESKRPPD